MAAEPLKSYPAPPAWVSPAASKPKNGLPSPLTAIWKPYVTPSSSATGSLNMKVTKSSYCPPPAIGPPAAEEAGADSEPITVACSTRRAW